MTKKRIVRINKLVCISFLISFLFVVHVRAQQIPSVYISEIAWAGSIISTADEWVELANAEDRDIDISGWTISRLSDGVEKEMVVIASGRIPSHGNFLIANYAPPDTVLPQIGDGVTTDVSLANTKLQLKLYDSNTILIDTADDGVGIPLAGSNALKASMERVLPVTDGTLKESWATSTTLIDSADSTKGYGTPKIAGYPHISLDQNHLYYSIGQDITIRGSFSSPLYAHDELSLEVLCGLRSASVVKDTNGMFSAIISLSENVSQCTATLVDPRMVNASSILKLTQLSHLGAIVISEVMPDPDAGDEWIEIHNQSNEDVDLVDWQLDDIRGSGSKSFTFLHQIIMAGEFLTLTKSTTGIGLNNDGDEINLIDPLGNVVDTTTYNDAPANQSWVRLNERSFAWSGFQTPSKENELPERINYYGLLAIHEVLPNPNGSDEEGEWVEIISHAPKPVDVNGWSIDDGDGGSRPYIFSVETLIQPNQLFVIKRPVSKVAFNNDTDSVRLIAPDTSLMDSVTYAGATQGESYAYFDDGWQWTNHPTQGDINIHRESAPTITEPTDQPTLQTQPLVSDPVIVQVTPESETIHDLPVDTIVQDETHYTEDSIPSIIMDIPNSDNVQTNHDTPDNGYIMGAQSHRDRPVPLLIALFSGILLSVILGATNIWHTIQLRQKKGSKTTPDSTHPG